jgi:hypothetical protein
MSCSKSATHLNDASTAVQLELPTAGVFLRQSRNVHLPYILDNSAHTWRSRSHAEAGTIHLTLLAPNPAVNTPMPSPEWLEDGELDVLGGSDIGAGRLDTGVTGKGGGCRINIKLHTRNRCMPSTYIDCELCKSSRLERISHAMTERPLELSRWYIVDVYGNSILFDIC